MCKSYRYTSTQRAIVVAEYKTHEEEKRINNLANQPESKVSSIGGSPMAAIKYEYCEQIGNANLISNNVGSSPTVFNF